MERGQALSTSMRRGFAASALRIVMVRIPCLLSARTCLVSRLSGSWRAREKRPKLRSRRCALFALSGAADLISGDDLMDLTTVGNDAVVVHGGYDSSFELFTTSVERVPLTLAGSGTQTVTAAAPVKILEATSQCTKVNFVVGNGSAVLVGLQDRNGRRVVSITP